MDPAGVSGTVTVEDQRSYIKIETLRGKKPTEIHRALSEVCSESTVDRSTVSRWVHRFRVGRMSIDDDPRPIAMRLVRNSLKLREFPQHQYTAF
ncbi:hypothetical protein C0J52_19326 [Blattella germanica]|nr:hypothetical protein C0J52_19326 [Blattella germanica]